MLEGPAAGRKVVVTPDGARVGSLGAVHADAEAAALADELMWTDTSRAGRIHVTA